MSRNVLKCRVSGETIAYIVTQERLGAPSIEEALSRAMTRLEGAYSLVLMSPQKLICACDPHGFRPLRFGKTSDGTWVIASESCALHAVGAAMIRDVEPGEILIFSKNGVQSRREHCGKTQPRHCIFEYIYFARPDSVLDGVSVHSARLRAGAFFPLANGWENRVKYGLSETGGKRSFYPSVPGR